MQRRRFLINSGKLAVGIGVFGSIQWKDGRFVGDTPTTTDILGPFYRPNSPVRININPADYKGPLFHLSGTVFREDGKTPYKNCMVEIWQCDSKEVYDNSSDDYRYRGAQKTGADGKYHFITCHPIPYKASPDSDRYRPAHIHMRVSGEGQQDLVTQVYFKDDPHISSDRFSSRPEASERILPISQNKKGEEEVRFDVVMAKEIKPSDSFFASICGIYQLKNDSMVEFYREDDSLFYKRNGQILGVAMYRSANQFYTSTGDTFQFEVKPDKSVTVCMTREGNSQCVFEGVKAFKY